MDDEEYLYQRCESIGKRPSEDDIEWFIEKVGKHKNDGKATTEARILAFRERYS